MAPRGLGELWDSLQDSQGSQVTLVHSKGFNGFGGLSHRHQNSRHREKKTHCKISQTKSSTYLSIKWDVWTSTEEAEPRAISDALIIKAKEGEADCS